MPVFEEGHLSRKYCHIFPFTLPRKTCQGKLASINEALAILAFGDPSIVPRLRSRARMKMSNFERKYSPLVWSHDLYWENKIDKRKRTIPNRQNDVISVSCICLELSMLRNWNLCCLSTCKISSFK